MIIIESKRKKAATILKMYPDAILADVTSGAKDEVVMGTVLSHRSRHTQVPVPATRSGISINRSIISDT